MGNIDDQVADIRERVAGLERDVSWIRRKLEEKTGGNIVLPVAAVIAILEIVKVAIERIA